MTQDGHMIQIHLNIIGKSSNHHGKSSGIHWELYTNHGHIIPKSFNNHQTNDAQNHKLHVFLHQKEMNKSIKNKHLFSFLPESFNS